MTPYLLWALACTDAPTTPKESIAPLPESAPPLVLPDITVRGVIFIEVDTLRRDHLPQYGYARNTMPHMAEYSWHQINGHYAPASWTLPSVSSLLSSLEPARHGVFASEGGGVPTSRFTSPSWPVALQGSGWATAVFTGNRWFSEVSGLGPLFETAYVAGKDETGQANLGVLMPQVLTWLDALPEGNKFYLHLQPMDAHEPYLPRPEDLEVFREAALPFIVGEEGATPSQIARVWADAPTREDQREIESAVVDIYDAQLLGLDRSLYDLMNSLADRGLLAETLVVFSSDHGELLGDTGAGEFGHAIRWHQSEAQLPLLLLAPGIEGGTSDCLSMNLDLWPTIAGMIGAEPLGDIDGLDLRQACRGSVRGSDWSAPEILHDYGVASSLSALNHRCGSGREQGTPLGDDADATEKTRAEKLEDGAQLTTLLDEAYADVMAERPAAKCRN